MLPARRIAVRGATGKKRGSPLRAATPETPRVHAEAKRGVATATDKAGSEWNPSGATEVTPIWYSGLAAEKCVALSIVLFVGPIFVQHVNARRIAARWSALRRCVGGLLFFIRRKVGRVAAVCILVPCGMLDGRGCQSLAPGKSNHLPQAKSHIMVQSGALTSTPQIIMTRDMYTISGAISRTI